MEEAALGQIPSVPAVTQARRREPGAASGPTDYGTVTVVPSPDVVMLNVPAVVDE